MIKEAKFSDLIGKTIKNIKIEYSSGETFHSDRSDSIKFYINKKKYYKMYHTQDCCESVNIKQIDGCLKDIVGHPIINAECITDKVGEDEYYESITYTFYKIKTAGGDVTISWYGGSNGWYSEEVDFAYEDGVKNV